jgi:hypothetical protein
MAIKGLPKEFRPFTTVITQREKAPSFQEFKVALRNFEEMEKITSTEEGNNVMKVNYVNTKPPVTSNASVQ